MTQIRIEEKKSGGSIWPWIIGLLILGLAVWGIAEAFEESDETYTEEVLEDDDSVAGVATGIDENNNYKEYETDDDYTGAVSAYLATTENMEGEMGLDHEFSHQALTELARATVALAENKGLTTDAAMQDKVNQVEQLSDDIMKDPLAGDHADKIRKAAMMITEMLENIDNEAYNGQSAEDLSKLRQEAQAITPETLTLNQKEDVRSFFRQARMVLERMS
ncbi:hypothetical protein GGR26_000891 [Lewinella marina]|uniref:Uncharacterized protein n=1 Tax=Neolewinella marina TaxID=438751 RepID=A0A2G0CIC7_9BACT|nr:hypothetical protein [Neolewinella marina]NJB85146.1 hypothetical protein [Neolewinella marina]PHK99719.1 hypothetical protein CGL56_01325 [Neolewinella marina]